MALALPLMPAVVKKEVMVKLIAFCKIEKELSAASGPPKKSTLWWAK